MSWWRWVSKLVKRDFIALIIVSGDVDGDGSIALIVIASMYDICEGIRGHFSKAKLIFVVILLYHAKNGNTIKTVFFLLK